MIIEENFINFIDREIFKTEEAINECIASRDYGYASELSGALSVYYMLKECITKSTEYTGIDWKVSDLD